jgi:transmembrane sensor
MDSLSQIKDVAAQWLARRGSETWSAADEAQLEQWLNASTGNRVAFLRLQAAWQEADRLKILGAGFDRGVVPSLEDFRAAPFFKHIGRQVPASEVSALPERPATPDPGILKPIVRWAVAASMLLAVALFTWNYAFTAGNVYATPVGVTAAVPLSDGSKITLNTDTEIRVAVTETERRVNLEQGEAFFDVAKDPKRPFIVRAGDKLITAVGTQFSVRRDHDDVRVVVTEGEVRVEQANRGSVPSTQVSAGGVASAQHDDVAVQQRPLPEVEELLSWRSGYVVFHENTLAEAVAEFNRYNIRKIVIQDPEVAGISISGNFRSTNVDSFAQLLEDGFPVVVDRQSDRIVLTKREL